MAASHYETLGIAEGAPPDDVRRAYLDLARRLHPDRWSGASPEERARAERHMQEVNEAWRVLGNAGRRLAYDTTRRPTAARVATASMPFPTGDLFVDEAPPDAVSRIIRALPWALVLLALGAIFVFTAYATGDPDGGTSCVEPNGSAAPSVRCEAPGARVVELRVPDAGLCPPGTEAFQPAGDTNALCLRV